MAGTGDIEAVGEMLVADSPIGTLRRVTEAVEKKADIAETDVADALSWFLEESPQDPSADLAEFRVNIAPSGEDKPKWATFTFRPLTDAEIQRARKEGEKNAGRAARRSGTAEPDLFEQAAYMVALSMVNPDLLEAARVKGLAIDADPAITRARVLKHRMAYKPGLIMQLMDRVLTLSGYNDDDVKDAPKVAVEAGKH